MDHMYRRLLRFRTSQGVPSTTQFAQGVPESMTVHRTLRELQALHATAARLDGRDVAGAGAGEDIVVEEEPGDLAVPFGGRPLWNNSGSGWDHPSHASGCL